MSLPYFHNNGWEIEVVSVEENYVDAPKDPILLKSVPEFIKIHKVRAFSKKWTSKIGLGSIALRSLWFYKIKVNEIIKQGKFDLIYFSTTQFPVCVLGAYWKKRFGVPYVIDMQDPWHSDYYQDKPKHQRPPKYWFSYRLNKLLEPIAMRSVDGLISVSMPYVDTLKERYPNIKDISFKLITFGYSDIDYALASSLKSNLSLPEGKQNLTYIGVLGPMMTKSLTLFFKAVSNISNFQNEYFLYLKGTSYAEKNKAKQTAVPIAKNHNIYNLLEDTERIGIFEVLNLLSKADGLVIFGTDNDSYTASKLYPYLQCNKPILAILHPKSSASEILKTLSNSVIVSIFDDDEMVLTKISMYFEQIKSNSFNVDRELLAQFSAVEMTKKQCDLFNQIIK